MAEVIVDVNVDTGDAVKDVEKLTNAVTKLKAELNQGVGAENFDTLNKELKEAESNLSDLSEAVEDVPIEESQQQFKDLGKVITGSVQNGVASVDQLGNSVGDLKTPTKGASTGFKGLGTAIKATGIGLVVAIVAALTEAFSRNKKVMDAVTLVFDTIQQVFSQVVDALVETYESVTESSERFDALGKVMSGILTLSLLPLKTAFFGIKLGIQELQLAWEDSFLGGGDDNVIKELTADVEQTKQDLIELGEAAIQAGSDIVTNFSEAASEVGNIASETIDNLSDVSVSAARAQAEANKAAVDGSILAEAQAQRVVAQYERQAERLRQIRDNEAASIAERQAANEKLAIVLDDQEKALLRQAQAVIAGAQAEFQKEDSIENQAAITSALAGLDQVRADIEGKRSEQLVNQTALLKEQADLGITVAENEAERRRIQAQFEADQETDPLVKLAKQREVLTLENEQILLDLEVKKEIYALGTQARIDAEQDYLNRKQDIDNRIFENEKGLAVAKEEIGEAELESKKGNLEAVGKIAGDLSSLTAKNTAAGKGLAVASASMNTYEAITGTLNNAAKSPAGAIPGYAIAQSIATGVAGLASVKKILSVKVPGGGGGGGSAPSLSGGGGGGGSAPNFGGVDFSFLGEGGQSAASDFTSLDGESSPQGSTVRAYVTSSEITDQQTADQTVSELASLNTSD